MAFGTKRNAAVFVDGSNIYSTCKAVGFELDFKKIVLYYRSKFELLRANYYTAVPDRGVTNTIQPFVDFLSYNGWNVIQKPTKNFTNEHGAMFTKGNMDCEIIVDCKNIAERVQDIIIFSGDGDFRYLVEDLQRNGVRVTVVSSMTTPPMIADELLRQSDIFLDIKDMKQHWLRDEVKHG